MASVIDGALFQCNGTDMKSKALQPLCVTAAEKAQTNNQNFFIDIYNHFLFPFLSTLQKDLTRIFDASEVLKRFLQLLQYWWAKEAVLAYPENYQYLEWLASAEYQLAYDENRSPNGSIEHLNELTDNALRRYESIIDSCSDVELIRQAIIGKIIVLVFIGRTDEADWSAEFEYPDIAVNTADEVLKMSCVGRELLALQEKEKITKD